MSLRKQIQDNKEIEQKLQDKIKALSQLQAEYEIVQPDMPVLYSALPEKAEISDIVKTLETIVVQNQATLSAIQVGETFLSEKESSPTAIYVQKNLVPITLFFSSEGSYINLVKVLEKMNHLPRLYAVQNISMAKTADKIASTLKIKAYYLPL